MKKKIIIYSTAALFLIISAWYFIPSQKLDTSKPIDKIIVIKHKRQLQVWSKNELLKTYKISLGFEPVGHKHYEGDGKTPEGVYKINDKNPNSNYHLNLGISYPNNKDKEYAKKSGNSPGGDIKIHGLKNSRNFIGKFHRLFDWTKGCIALTNDEVEELYYNVKIGTVIEIMP